MFLSIIITRNCAGYEYYSDNYPDIWNKKICNLKRSVDNFIKMSFVTSGHGFYVCSASLMTDHEAIGQNIKTIRVRFVLLILSHFLVLFCQVNSSEECQELCKTTPGCAGYYVSNNTCYLKSNIEYYQYERGSESGQLCYRPGSYVNMSVSLDDVLGEY